MFRTFATLVFCVGIVITSYAAEPKNQPPATENPTVETHPAFGQCQLNRMEMALALKMLESPDQEREKLLCNSELNEFAAWRAKDMAERNYFDHVTPENQGANELLRQYGYALPRYYSHGRGNNIEAIVGGVRDPGKAWQRLLESASHRKHVLGTHEVYRQQTEFGIAYHFGEDTSYVDYWVLIIARPFDPADPNLVCTPPPSTCFDFTIDGENDEKE